MARVSIGMICLQTEAGLVFGNTTRIDKQHVTFEVDAKLRTGDELGWRMELRGWESTVQGRLLVGRVARVPGEPVVLVEARFTAMPSEDEQLLEQWLAEIHEGGTPRRLERNPDKLKSNYANEGMTGASAQQTANALARMTARKERARRNRNAALSQSEPPMSDASDIGLVGESQTSRVAVARGRAAMRSALKSGLSQVSQVAEDQAEQGSRRSRLASVLKRTDERRRRREGDTNHSVPPPRARREAAPVPAPPEPPAPRPDPMSERRCFLHEGPQSTVVVVYPSMESYRADYKANLSSSGVQILRLAPWSLFERLKVELMLPGGTVIRVDATLVAELGDSVALSLELSSTDRARMRQLAD